MSVYGPKIRLPRISLPRFSLPSIKVSPKKIGIILIIILIIATIVAFYPSIENINFNSHIGVYWNNNPLNLKDSLTKNAELTIVLTNNTEKVQDINLSVTTESDELIIFCPYKTFENIETNNNRQTTCLIKRNPNTTIFSGSYTITIKTNLGETKTVLQIITQ